MNAHRSHTTQCSDLSLTFVICYFVAGNGFIPTSSLREILAAMDDQLTEEQLIDIIAEIDTDGSGTVDFDGKNGVATL